MRPSSSSPRSASRQQSPLPRRTVLVDLAIVNVVAVALVAIFLDGSLAEWGGDNVEFLLLARALATGEGYVDLHLAGTPPHVHYPPLFPLLLAPLVALGAPLVALKGWTAVLSVAGLNAAYLLLASSDGRSVAMLSVLCTLCAGAFLDPALSVMSDGPYVLFSVLALLGVSRLARGGRTTALRVASAGALIGAAILIRTVGVVLLPALIVHAAVDRRTDAPPRRRVGGALLVAVVAGAVASPWFVWAALQEDAERRTYLGEFATEAGAATSPSATRGTTVEDPGLVRRIAVRPVQNLADIAARLSRSAGDEATGVSGEGRGSPLSWTFVALCGLLGAMTAAGLVRALVVRRDARDWYVAGYLALLAVWVGGGFRLVMPVLVFLFAYCHDGVAWAVRRILRSGLRRDPERSEIAALRAGTATLALLLVANVGITLTFPKVRDRLNGRYAPWWHEYLAEVRALGSTARPGDLVLSAPDNVPYYVAGLRAPRIRAAGNDERAAIDALHASGTTYVISTPFLRTYSVHVARCLRDFPGRFETINGEGDVRVYRLLGDSETASDPPAAKPDDASPTRAGHVPAPSESDR